MKKCEIETCNRMAIPGERFCKMCKTNELRRLKEVGYLTPEYSRTERPEEKKERIRDTKHGTEQG